MYYTTILVAGKYPGRLNRSSAYLVAAEWQHVTLKHPKRNPRQLSVRDHLPDRSIRPPGPVLDKVAEDCACVRASLPASSWPWQVQAPCAQGFSHSGKEEAVQFLGLSVPHATHAKVRQNSEVLLLLYTLRPRRLLFFQMNPNSCLSRFGQKRHSCLGQRNHCGTPACLQLVITSYSIH